MFADRLINDEDKIYLINHMRKTFTKFFGLNFDTVCAHLDKEIPGKGKDGKVDTIDELRGLIWTDIMTPMGGKRVYEEMVDYPRL